ncbi:MAG: hypothetical protein N3G20_05290, partial [Verrucomicrobiae bacterium]|nr:hypothetical protein [Verrucomicrobiae bacterium]
MKSRCTVFGLGLAAFLVQCVFTVSLLNTRAADSASAAIRLLIVTGGHDYETNQFYRMFDGFGNVRYQKAVHPQAHEWLKPDRAVQYDAIVLLSLIH